MEALAAYILGMGWTDWAGWLGTGMFSLSFLVKRRMMLHALGTLACIPKLIYSFDAQARLGGKGAAVDTNGHVII